jgi:aminopeptidase N
VTRPVLERRNVLRSALALLALPSPAWSAPPEEAFGTLSVALLGTSVDPELSFKYQKALRAGPNATAVERLMALATTHGGAALLQRIAGEGLQPATNLVVGAWYSGMVDGRVITYTDALAWSAVSFTKPNGACGGAFGYWAEPPAK